MSDRPEYLQLEPGDDAIAVRDRLTFFRGKRVLLIWPDEGKSLTRKLDLVLIQREAMRLAIRLAIVTHDSTITRYAEELDISAFETISASERTRWKRGRSRVFATRLKRPESEYDPDDLMPYASRVRYDDEPNAVQRAASMAIRAVVLLLLLVVLGVALILAVPGAIVTISPAQVVASTEAIITADPTLGQSFIDVENGVIPAITLRAEIEERGTIPTSGTQELSSTPAVGTVVFINRGANRVQIPAGALVSSGAGTPILFRTLEEVTVPSGQGSQIEAPIEAIPESSGEIGNLDTGQINVVVGPLADSVEVRNLAPTYGGERRIASIVTAEDRDRLVAVLRQQLQERAYRELAPRASATQFIIPETVRIAEERSDWMRFDYDVGQAADNLTLTMRAIVAVTAVEETFAQQVAYARLGSQVARGRAIAPDSVRYERGSVLSIEADGRVYFALQASATVEARFDASALAERLAGRSTEDALRYLAAELDLAAGTLPIIELAPDWLDRMPLLPARISIRTAGPEPDTLIGGPDTQAGPTPTPLILPTSESG